MTHGYEHFIPFPATNANTAAAFSGPEALNFFVHQWEHF
jgi:hypothetical protein